MLLENFFTSFVNGDSDLRSKSSRVLSLKRIDSHVVPFLGVQACVSKDKIRSLASLRILASASLTDAN